MIVTFLAMCFFIIFYFIAQMGQTFVDMRNYRGIHLVIMVCSTIVMRVAMWFSRRSRNWFEGGQEIRNL